MKCRAWIMAGLMAAGMMGVALGETPVVSHDDSFSKEDLFKADVSTLKDTQLVAHPDVPLAADKNVLWCGTLQLAWNKAIDLVGEWLHFTTPSPTADLLNRKDFTAADLDPGSYVALADFEKNNVEDEIRVALEKTFHGAASPELIPEKPAHPGPSDFVAYAYLYKNLAFLHPFVDLDDPLSFQGKKVQSFGFKKDRSNIPDGALAQVSICDYQSEDNFIIKLKTKSPNDELILAKIPPGPTLQITMTQVLDRIGNSTPTYTSATRDCLVIPKLNFDLRGDFQALEGLIFKFSPTVHIKGGLVLAKVEQLVRFQLNEKGAILKSEAVMGTVGSSGEPPPPPHTMIFDKPFLILMKQANSDKPYFALWVGNASLLVPAGKP